MVYYADLNEGFVNSFLYLNKYYGITKISNTNDFVIIMKYYELGSLKDYMAKNFYKIKWNEKLNILQKFVTGLNHLHHQILFIKIFTVEIFFMKMNIVISYLGISKSLIVNKDGKIYGILPYMTPEILQGKEYTTASDIYSFDMIMW